MGVIMPRQMTINILLIENNFSDILVHEQFPNI